MTLEDSQWNDQKPVTEEEAIIETRLDECLGNLPMLLGKVSLQSFDCIVCNA